MCQKPHYVQYCCSTPSYGSVFVIRLNLIFLISGQNCKKFHQIFFAPDQIQPISRIGGRRARALAIFFCLFFLFFFLAPHHPSRVARNRSPTARPCPFRSSRRRRSDDRRAPFPFPFPVRITPTVSPVFGEVIVLSC